MFGFNNNYTREIYRISIPIGKMEEIFKQFHQAFSYLFFLFTMKLVMLQLYNLSSGVHL